MRLEVKFIFIILSIYSKSLNNCLYAWLSGSILIAALYASLASSFFSKAICATAILWNPPLSAVLYPAPKFESQKNKDGQEETVEVSERRDLTGFIKSLAYSVPDESPWEIKKGKRVYGT